MEQRREVIDLLLKWYRDDSDSGIHGAIDWLLRPEKDGSETRKMVWGQAKKLKEIDSALADKLVSVPKDRNWFVNSEGQTFVLLNSREPFLMSSPVTERNRIDGNEAQHWRRLDRMYAISTRPVTMSEFERFKAATKSSHIYTRKYAPEEDCPAISVSWYEAIQYCRWLSEEEGLSPEDMVYPKLDEIAKASREKTPLSMPKDYLRKKGYRLLTEAEWEHAARGGTLTTYYFGGAQELLREYGWYTTNTNDERSWPSGQKKPNELGLFDMTGNVFCWTQSRFFRYPVGTRSNPGVDPEGEQSITDSDSLVMRGGSFNKPATVLRSSNRSGNRPSFRSDTVGFRLARTLD